MVMFFVYATAVFMALVTIYSCWLVAFRDTLGTDTATAEHFGGVNSHKWPWQ